MQKTYQRASYSFLYLVIAWMLCWLTYTYITIFNYAESVVSDMQNDLSRYIDSNEKIAAQVAQIIPLLEASSDNNQSLSLQRIEELDLEGFNISPDRFFEYAGSLIAEGEVKDTPFDLSGLLHELDRIWANEDNNAPGAFFTYYQKGKEFAYAKSRLRPTSTPPKLTPFRYRKDDIPITYKKPLLTTVDRSYPKGNSIVILITPVFVKGELIGDLGMRLKLEKQMLDSLGPWLSQYVALDISFRDQTFSVGEDRFFSNVLYKQATFDGITVTASIQTDYITKFILPWFLSMILVMGMVYCLLNKHRKEAIEFSSLSKTDALTGLYNKRILNEIERLGGNSGTIFYIDVNDFKQINDDKGHQIGDQALRHIAARIKNCMRESDLCIRLGGDEFLVVTNKKVRDPELVKEKIHKSISDHDFIQDVQLKVSIGYDYFDDIETLEQAIHQADKRMYEEKNRLRKEELST